ncbi:hypothetical protein SJAG_01395 [Schizosaccharomyces japonicus yFS275]|uniref:Uncharacterized protein n=1 Tax=Schizosaccharomyces japonicus (strain yFS275 / FY16936) TaxID=402676 RepID=B6JXT3_SCHJY|nr:hypothetical protein SJAG_01395 [Schizosaccharomyces japonicus yFS275]EEB06351.1 hypothetical protein SJAG_01395 [Schizosaccharomyces japonicus yFS275]
MARPYMHNDDESTNSIPLRDLRPPARNSQQSTVGIHTDVDVETDVDVHSPFLDPASPDLSEQDINSRVLDPSDFPGIHQLDGLGTLDDIDAGSAAQHEPGLKLPLLLARPRPLRLFPRRAMSG